MYQNFKTRIWSEIYSGVILIFLKLIFRALLVDRICRFFVHPTKPNMYIHITYAFVCFLVQESKIIAILYFLPKINHNNRHNFLTNTKFNVFFTSRNVEVRQKNITLTINHTYLCSFTFNLSISKATQNTSEQSCVYISGQKRASWIS